MEELLQNINAQYNEFVTNSTAAAKGNKAAGVRARKNALTLMNLCKQYRKESV